MPGYRQTICGLLAAAGIACSATPAVAGGHSFGPLHPWGLGHGLFGAVAGLATLPIALASAVLSAGDSDGSSGYGAAPRGYASPPAYPAPPAYYVPPRYYPPAPLYYPAPHAYYAPGAYYAPRGVVHGGYGSYGGNGGYAGYGGNGRYGHGAYRPGGYAHPHR
jgi:hypothetical protein